LDLYQIGKRETIAMDIPPRVHHCSAMLGLDFHTAIQMYGAFAVLVITKGFHRQ